MEVLVANVTFTPNMRIYSHQRSENFERAKNQKIG